MIKESKNKEILPLILIFTFSIIVGYFMLPQKNIIELMKKEYISQRPQELALIIKDLQSKNKTLINEENRLSDKILSYYKYANDVEAQIASMKEELKHLEIVKGNVGIEGEGVIVEIMEFPFGENSTTIREEDLLILINDFWSAGAEVISINDIRLKNSSYIRRSGLDVYVGYKALKFPLTIKAIGDKETLIPSLEISGGIVDLLRIKGIQVTIKGEDKVIIK